MGQKFKDIQDFLALLRNVRGPNASGNFTARCPAHDDKTASLTVCEKVSGKDGKRRIYLYCQTKVCTTQDILARLGLTARDLILDGATDKPAGKRSAGGKAAAGYSVEKLPGGKVVYTGTGAADGAAGASPAFGADAKGNGRTGAGGAAGKAAAAKASGGLGKLTNAYDYKDADGKVLFQVCRFEKTGEDGKREKTFRQRRYAPDDPAAKKDGYVWAVPDEWREHTLYHLPEVLEAIKQGTTVYVVEGEKDADTMARLGYTATTNAQGAGKWHEGHTELLSGADVVVLYDCDTKENKFAGQKHGWEVAKALKAVAKNVRLPDIKAICPELPPKGDVSDLFQLLGDERGKKLLDGLVSSCAAFDPNSVPPWYDGLEAAAEMYEKVGGYCVDNGCICQRTEEGPRKLGTFVAIPSMIVTRDDGVNTEKVFVIDGWARGGGKLPQIQVQAAKFAGMSWVLEGWDFAANIMPGNVVKDKLRYAIAEVGEMAAKRQTVYTHTGWRKIGGKWAYLYQGGAIGVENVSVDLDGAIGSYTFDTDEDIPLLDAARQSFEIRGCMTDHIAVPMLGAMFLSPLCEFLSQAGSAPGFALFLLGGTGSHKSTVIALLLSYFGKFHSKNLPASFNDTPNSVRKKAFLLKDFPIAVDDYHPETSVQERRKMESMAQSLSRAFGDGADRGRMKADLSLQKAMPPRGIPVMSGEDLPNISEGGAARYYIVNIGKNDVPITDQLTEAQAMAKRGVLRRVMRGYIEWLLPQADKLPKLLEGMFMRLRSQAGKETQGVHDRAPEAVAHIMLGYSMMQNYLIDIGAMTKEAADADFLDAWKVLVENSQEQGKDARDERPCRMFISAISELLVNKTADVKDLTLTNSPNPGKGMIGYMDAEHFYLLPETSYTMVAKLFGEQGMTFPLSKRLLFKQLRDDGFTVPDTDGKTTRSKSIGGKVMRLLWVPRRHIDGVQPAEVQMKIDGYVEVEDPEMPF